MSLFDKFREFLIRRSRNQKSFILILSDLFTLNFFLFIRELITFFFPKQIENFPLINFSINESLNVLIIINIFSISVIYLLDGYKSFFRIMSARSFIGQARLAGTFMYISLIFLFLYFEQNSLLPSFLFILNVLAWTFFSFVVVRTLAINFLTNKNLINRTPVLIYGAGQAGRETAASIDLNDKYKIIGFIDDDKKLRKFNLLGHKVIGNLQKIAKIKKDYDNLLVVMAIVNISASERRKIISLLEQFNVKVKTIPKSYGSLITKLSLENLDVSDLIERSSENYLSEKIKRSFENKKILITGAGGSIGAELSLQLASLNSEKLILIDNSEFNLYQLGRKLSDLKKFNNENFLLRDIQNSEELEKIIISEKIDTIFHAAAYKHVPILESIENFKEALNNNFFATYNLCDIAFRNNVKNLTLVSTDKAVNPTNIMGASKRLAELSLQAFQDNKINKTCYSMVRFGNVLNSSGSVVPLFWEQIYQGGPLTVTHKDINRFFMSIEEASSLVIKSSKMAKGGEVFLLDMGKPIKIKDLAEKMIRLSGNSVSNNKNEEGIKIVFTGLRPGEKLYEELLLSNNPIDTKDPLIKMGIEKGLDFEGMVNLKNKISSLLDENDLANCKKVISDAVNGSF